MDLGIFEVWCSRMHFGTSPSGLLWASPSYVGSMALWFAGGASLFSIRRYRDLMPSEDLLPIRWKIDVLGARNLRLPLLARNHHCQWLVMSCRSTDCRCFGGKHLNHLLSAIMLDSFTFLSIPFHSFTFLYIVESCRVILHHSPGSQNKPTHVDCCFGEVLRWEIATFSIVTLRNLGIMLMALWLSFLRLFWGDRNSNTLW